jgi:TPR repeat protein
MRQHATLIRVTLVASIMLVAIAGAAAAGPLEDARGAYQHGDYATAYRLFRPLADRGNAAAQTNLGVMYSNGQGVPQSYAEALKWFRKAASQGDAAAQFNLGFMYRMGHGVPQNYVLAHMWFDLAASQFPASKKEGRDIAIQARDSSAANMTSSQITKAQKLAREWKPTPKTPKPETAPEWW